MTSAGRVLSYVYLSIEFDASLTLRHASLITSPVNYSRLSSSHQSPAHLSISSSRLLLPLTARRLAPLLRRHERDHLPRAHLLLRREARGGPARQPPRGLLPPLEGRLRQQAARAHDAYFVLEQVRFVGAQAGGRGRGVSALCAQLWERAEE